MPDLRDRVIVGQGTRAGVNYALGQTGGSATGTLTGAQTTSLHAHPSGANGAGTMSASAASVTADTMQPWIALNIVIVTAGIYPSRSRRRLLEFHTENAYDAYLAQILILATSTVPRDTMTCSGQLLAIGSNQALVSPPH